MAITQLRQVGDADVEHDHLNGAANYACQAERVPNHTAPARDGQ